MMKISLDRALAMNKPNHPDFPHRPAGVPTSYSWYPGKSTGSSPTAPAGFTAISHWGQFHRVVGNEQNGVGKLECRSYIGWVRRKSDKVWVQTQTIGQQGSTNFKLEGGMFDAKFTTNAAVPGSVETLAGQAGGLFLTPGPNQCNHFWPGPRGIFAADQFDYPATYMEVRAQNAADVGHFILQMGNDWWAFGNAGTPNPDGGHSNWLDVTTEWQPYLFYSCSDAELQANPPPCIGEAAPIPPDPVHGWSGTITVKDGLITSVG